MANAFTVALASSLAHRAALRPCAPFSDVKVRGHTMRPAPAAAIGFSEGAWLLLRTIADGLGCAYGWSAPAAQRLRFCSTLAVHRVYPQANSLMPYCEILVSTNTASRSSISSARAANPAKWSCHHWQPMRSTNICSSGAYPRPGNTGTQQLRSSRALVRMVVPALPVCVCGHDVSIFPEDR